MVIVEAFAMGLPVIASRLGAMGTIVNHESTGLHFNAGDADDLAAKVRCFYEHPQAARQMRNNARREFERRYTGERNYRSLMKIYKDTIARFDQRECPSTEPASAPEEDALNLVQLAGQLRSEIAHFDRAPLEIAVARYLYSKQHALRHKHKRPRHEGQPD